MFLCCTMIKDYMNIYEVSINKLVAHSPISILETSWKNCQSMDFHISYVERINVTPQFKYELSFITEY